MNDLDSLNNRDEMSELDERVLQHYQSRVLSNARLNDIMHADHLQHGRRQVLGLGLAACAAGLAGGVTGALFFRHGSITERTRSLVREAALNHMTELTVDFSTNSLSELNRQMELLTFSVSLPDSLNYSMDLLGARYCTVSGNLAVHVKLFNQVSQRAVSLFMTPVFAELESLGWQRSTVGSVNVELWQEEDLFFAMAY